MAKTGDPPELIHKFNVITNKSTNELYTLKLGKNSMGKMENKGVEVQDASIAIINMKVWSWRASLHVAKTSTLKHDSASGTNTA